MPPEPREVASLLQVCCRVLGAAERLHKQDPDLLDSRLSKQLCPNSTIMLALKASKSKENKHGPNPPEPLNASAPWQPALRVLAETAAVPPAAQQKFLGFANF